MSVVSNNILAGASGQGGGGYEIGRSLRFEDGDSSKLTRSFTANISSYTVSLWVKRSDLGRLQMFWDCGTKFIAFVADDRLALYNGSAYSHSTSVHRDPAAWMHLVLSVNSGTGTLYHNNTAIIENVSSMDLTGGGVIGEYSQGSYYFSGYLADIHFVDGQALAPTDFGETNTDNLWQPKEFDGTYGPSVDQSRTWSSDLSATSLANATMMFDWTYGYGNYTGTCNWDTTNSAYSNLSGRVYLANNTTVGLGITFKDSGGNSLGTFTVAWTGNGTEMQDTGFDWSSSVASVEITGNYLPVRVQIGSTTLVDSGVTVPNNGFHLDFADNSSNAALGTDTSGVSPANTWTVNNLSAAGSSSRLLNVDISTSLELYVTKIGNVSTQYVYVNGIDVTSQITINSWSTITGVGTVLNSVKVTGNSSGTIYYGLNGIKANGSWLIDTGTASPPTPNIIKDWSTDYLESNQFASRPITNAFNGEEGSYSSSFVGQTGGNFTGADVDSLVDTPTNGATASDTGAGGEITGCYATLNPLHKGTTTTLSNGNLEATNTGSWGSTVSSIGVSSGKWYAEVTIGAGTISYLAAGVSDLNSAYTTSYLGQTANSYLWFNGSGGGLYTAGAYTNQTGDWIVLCTNNDVIGLALDMDNGTLKYYKNGTLLGGGNAFTGITGTQFFATCGYSQTEIWNFGQRAFAYAAPSGYKSLNTANLSSTIADGSKYFDAKLYTSNSSSLSVTGYEFSPSFVWIKNRASAQMHGLFDVVRGANQFLSSNRTNAEHTTSGSGYGTGTFNSFDSNGFTLGDDIGQNSTNYPSGEGHVAWAWDAGDSNTPIAVGGLNSSVYDQSAVWSNDVTKGTGNIYSNEIYVPANIFNGNSSSYCKVEKGTNSGTVSMQLGSTISGVTKIRVNTNSVDNFTINGGSNIAATDGYQTIYEGSAITLSDLDFIRTSGVSSGGSDTGFFVYSIEINGLELIDSGVTPATNVPSIASTVRANPSAGFSIVSYTGSSSGTTVGHGLNAAPEMIIVKDRDNGYNWQVAHSGIGADESFIFDTNPATDYNAWNNTRPTSSVFSLGAGTLGVNTDGADLIAYCFAPVEGYSAMGSYTGNGSTTGDGPFVYTGFKPAWILFKNTGSGSWNIYDTARDTYNVADNGLLADSANDEFSGSPRCDFLSNGFKVRAANGAAPNASATYIYLALASHPFASNGGLAR